MNLAFVASPTAINSTYRAYFPMLALQRRGHLVHHNRPGEPHWQLDVLLEADAVLVHRFLDQESRRAMRRLRDAGVGIVWDDDDDVTNLPETNPLYRAHSGLNRQRIVSEQSTVLGLADVATTPSTVLADRFSAAGAPDVRVLGNYLPPEFMDTPRGPSKGFQIAYLAGLEHQVDYQRLQLQTVFERLLDAHPELRILSIGVGLGLRTDRYEHHPLVPFLELPRLMSTADVGIAPIVDIPWNQARSDIKLKEYAAAGLPWLASPIGPYAGMGEQQGGRLVADDGWYEALDRMIVNGRERRKLAKRAGKWLKSQSIDQNVDGWERAFADAAARAQARIRTPATASTRSGS